MDNVSLDPQPQQQNPVDDTDLPTTTQYTDLHDHTDPPSEEDMEEGPAESVASSDEESTEEEGSEPVQPTTAHNKLQVLIDRWRKIHGPTLLPPVYYRELKRSIVYPLSADYVPPDDPDAPEEDELTFDEWRQDIVDRYRPEHIKLRHYEYDDSSEYPKDRPYDSRYDIYDCDFDLELWTAWKDSTPGFPP